MAKVISDTATLSDYWAVLRRRRRLIGVSAAVGFVLAGVWSLAAPPGYTAHASVLIRQIQADPFGTTRIEDVGASTEQNVMDSTVVASKAAAKLGKDDPIELLSHLSVENPPETLVLEVAFSAADPRAARDGAQAFATSYLDYRQDSADGVKDRKLDQLDAQTSALQTELVDAVAVADSPTSSATARAQAESRRGVLASRISEIAAQRSTVEATDTTPGELIRPAELPDAPSGPGRPITLLGGAALGLLLGIAVALFRDRADKHVAGHQDLVELLDEEPLAEIPAATKSLRKLRTVATVLEPDGALAGEYRRLRARVWPDRRSGPRRLLIASPTPATSADDVAGNLAATVASIGWDVVLGWVERSVPGNLFLDLPVAAHEMPDADAPLRDRLVDVPGSDGLRLGRALGRGTLASPFEVAEDHLRALDDLCEIQLVAADPILTSPQAIELAPLVDGVLVVFDPGVTTRAELVRALEVLGTAKVVGVVATNVAGRWAA
jgi:capsular polysaccharide biosynthesis protein